MISIVLKPWGSYEVLEKKSNYLIKRIIVTPGEMLSLQSHLYRSEHWVVVEGTAEVNLEDKIFTLQINENIFIPKLAKHRLTNKGLENLTVIEIWSGDILDEKDIIRYEDIYNRK